MQRLFKLTKLGLEPGIYMKTSEGQKIFRKQPLEILLDAII